MVKGMFLAELEEEDVDIIEDDDPFADCTAEEFLEDIIRASEETVKGENMSTWTWALVASVTACLFCLFLGAYISLG